MEENIFKPGHHNAQIETDLSEGPDLVATALLKWRRATLEREKIEGVLYAKLKAGEEKRTSEEIKALVRADGGRYAATLIEIQAESDYVRLNERLMAAKKMAGLRTAF